MSQQSIDYIVSLSKANEKISKLKSKASPETSELQLEIDSLKKSLSKANEKISKLKSKATPETSEIDSLKKSLSESNETIARLQLEKDEMHSDMKTITNSLQKYKLKYIHADNLSKFENIIKCGKTHKLLNFVKFDLKILFDHIFQILKMDDKTIMHIIDNCINLEEIVDSYKLIHHIVFNAEFNIIKYLIDKNIDLMHQNKLGNTPLHLACLCAKKDIIEYLIEKTNKVDIKNNNKTTPAQLLESNYTITNDERTSLIMKFEAKQREKL